MNLPNFEQTIQNRQSELGESQKTIIENTPFCTENCSF
jgi:hypothetical protein